MLFSSMDAKLLTTDPKPWAYALLGGDPKSWAREATQVTGGFLYLPRPEYAVVTAHPFNPILSDVRDDLERNPAKATEILQTWIDCLDDEDETTLDDMGDNDVDRSLEWENPAHWEAMRAHAWLVLTRFARIAGAL